jgi:hypothetical protein
LDKTSFDPSILADADRLLSYLDMHGGSSLIRSLPFDLQEEDTRCYCQEHGWVEALYRQEKGIVLEVIERRVNPEMLAKADATGEPLTVPYRELPPRLLGLTERGRARLVEARLASSGTVAADAVEHPSGDGKPPAVVRRTLTVDLDSKRLTLDGVPYDVSSERALRWVKILADNSPAWISSSELSSYDPDLTDVRSDRIKKYLPPEVRNLIDLRRGAGSRLDLCRK